MPFARLHIYNTLYSQRLMPLFNHADKDVCKQVLLAAYRGGARLFEFTNRGDFAHEIFSSLVQELSMEAPELIIGAGTIHDAATAALYMQCGASFIVTPSLKPEVIKICNTRKVAVIPGCSTLTEIAQAEELGCEVIKLFPAETSGPEFIKAVRAPHPWTSIMPSGGVDLTEESINAWFNAGAACVAMGSKLFPKELIEKKEFKEIENRVRKALSLTNNK